MPEKYYEDEWVTLYHGDCLELADVWTGADVLVTDPPYGMSLRSGRNGELGDLAIANDDTTDTREAMLRLWGEKSALVFGRWSVPHPERAKQVLIWEKSLLFGMGDLQIPWKPNTEEIYVCGSWPKRAVGRGSSVLQFDGPALSKQAGRAHPTEKPLGLMEHLIERCPPGVIADPFAGSGSTLIAARNLGRKAVGVELEEKYCEVIAKRLEATPLPLIVESTPAPITATGAFDLEGL